MPQSRLESKVIFILKPGRETYKVAKSFRPNLLPSFLLKGLERVVGWHMEQTVLTRNPLNRRQHGFRWTKSTETAIAEVVNYIESAMYQGQFAVAICLDIQGAFDNLNATKANEALKNYGFPPGQCYHYYGMGCGI